MRNRIVAAAIVLAAVTASPAWGQSDERQSRFMAFVERTTESARQLEQKARAIANDVAQSDEFARAEQEISDVGRDIAIFAEALGDEEAIESLTNDMRAWIRENRTRIGEMDELSRTKRTQLRALWRRQEAIVAGIGRRLEQVRDLTDEDFELLAEESAMRTEMARVGVERTSKRAQAFAAKEISKLALQLERIRKDIEEAAAQLSPES